MSDLSAVRTALRVPAHLTEEITGEGIALFVSRERHEVFAVDMPLSARAKAKRRSYITVSRQKFRGNAVCLATNGPSREADALEKEIAYIRESRAREVADHNRRETAKAAYDAREHFAPGDIVVNTWGYGQTNREFYQVEKVAAKSVALRRVKSDEVSDGPQSMSGRATPKKNDFETDRNLTGENGTHRAGPYGVKFKDGSGKKWDGKPMRFSRDN